MNLNEMLERNGRKFAGKAALRDGETTVTFGELADGAGRAAAVLQSWHVHKGDRVAIMSYNTWSFARAFFGVVRAGAVAVPVNHKLVAPEVDYILGHCRAKVLLVDGTLAPVAAGLTAPVRVATIGSPADGLEDFDALAAAASGAGPVTVADDDPAEFLYTSGTTGRPKACVHSHRNVVMAAITGALAVRYDQNDRVLLAMPIWHSSPLNNWFMAAQYMGATTVLLREYSAREFLETIQQERCTVYFGAPISYLAPLRMVPDFDRYDLSSVRAWIYGGGSIGAATARTIMEKYRSDSFYQVYGMTETGPTGTALFPAEQISKAGSIGRTGLPGADLKVMRTPAEEARAGEVGEIWLRADSMMAGYFEDPEASAEAFCDGWYRTGDVARIDDEGYLYIVDRIKDMIVTGGENVYSKEVEDALTEHPAIADAAVIGQPDPAWGETVTALVVLRPGAELDPDEIRTFLATRIARNKIPRSFTAVPDLPHTPSGKVMKFKLREELAEQPSADRDGVQRHV